MINRFKIWKYNFLKTTLHPTLILIRGLPGSGKTHLASALQDEIGADKVVMLDPDGTDYQSREYLKHTKTLTAEGVDPSLHAYRFLRAQAYQAIADHKIIIWNQPFTNLEIFKKMVDRLETQASQCQTDLPILVVEVEINPGSAKQRILERKQAGGHGPSDNTLERFISDYKSFSRQGFKTVRVEGDGDASHSVDLVMKQLAEIL